MPKIIFINHDGAEHVVDADTGETVMQSAINNMVPGIIADCGGMCACATCHGYIDAAWLARLPSPTDNERSLLECVPEYREGSRLTCQLAVTPELNGLVIRLPASQY